MSDCFTGFLITLGVVGGVSCFCSCIKIMCEPDSDLDLGGKSGSGTISGVYNVQSGK